MKMKTKITTKWLALLLMLLSVASSLTMLATSVSAAESYTPKPIPMKFTKEGAPEGYDGITVGKVYEHAYYTIDMDFLLDGFSAEDFFKNYTTQCDLKLRFIDDDAIWLHSDAKASYSLIEGYWTKEYPYITYWFEDTPKEESFWHCYCDIMHFTGPFTVPQVTVKFNLHDETPRFEYSLALYIEDHKTGLTVFSKRIRINLCDDSYKISELEIHDFDFQQKHGSLLQRDTTDVWCDVGNVVSIRYLEEDKKTEYTETAARAGMKGWVEFTISKGQNGCSFASEVQAKLFAGGYTGESVDVTTASDGSWCKAYFHFSIPDNETYVIKQGTIGLTAPEADAKANSKVTPSNVGLVPSRRPGIGKPTPQFTVGDATWLTMTGRDNKLTAVTSFSAGKTYFALVKLDPYGSYYFNDESVKNIKVPGASGFTITYQKAGTNAFTTEDGWYLFATFPKVKANYYDIAISYDKPEVSVPQDSSSYLTALCGADLSKATDLKVEWYYSADINKDNVGKQCAASDGELKLQLDTSKIGTGYYKCVITCKINGLESRMQYPSSEWVKVNVTEKAKDPLSLSAVGQQSVSINQKGQTVTFEVTAKNTSGNVNYTWFECDASGKVLDDVAIGTGKKLTLIDLDGEFGEAYYFKCVARDSKGSDSLIFSATIRYEDETTVTFPTDTDTNTDTDTDTDTDTKLPYTSNNDTDVPSTTVLDSNSDTDITPVTDNDGTTSPDTDNLPSDKADSGLPIWLIILIAVLCIGVIAIVIIVIANKKKKASGVK